MKPWSKIKEQMDPERFARLEQEIKEELDKMQPAGEQSPDFYCHVCDTFYYIPCEEHKEKENNK